MSRVDELLQRQYYGGVTVTNCVVHMGGSILDRPRECELCQSDIRNTLSRCIGMNEWLNTWKDDATKLFEEEVTA